MKAQTFEYLLHLADNALILGQRNAEWTGHGPVLEQDIAITNISLDLLGQARNLYQYAATIYNEAQPEEKFAFEPLIPRLWKNYNRQIDEDDLAFLRDEHQFRNLLLTELPRGDWARSIVRQFFFSVWQHLLYTTLQSAEDMHLRAIAEKSIKETAYHVRWSGEWMIRLGDGTDESHRRVNNAIEKLWPFTGELFQKADFDVIDPSVTRNDWYEKINQVFAEATLTLPADGWWQEGGKKGNHTEHLGYLLAEMQHLQRAFPNVTW